VSGFILDIVYFGTHDWSAMRQRAQQLAVRLAARHRVLYVNPCYYSAPGYIRDRLTKRGTRGAIWAVEQVSEKLQVASFPPLLPKGPEYPSLARINFTLQLPFIRSTLAQLEMHDPVLWFVTPADRALIGKLGERLTVYDCMDLHVGFHEGVTAARIAAEEVRLLRAVDVVFASSPQLVEHCRPHNPNVHLVRNGVDLANFSGSFPSLPDASPSLVLGYMGYIGPWMDVDLLIALARAYPQATLSLVGPVRTDLKGLDSLPNVRLWGERPYQEMGRFVQSFDVCLIPFAINALTEAVNPVKLYEYLALGKPVVSTALPELRHYDDVSYVAEDHAGFLEAVARALAEGDNPALANRRRACAEANRWEQRADEVMKVLADALA
jgi:glycosyltransferase involved in cell wall biosynthesis